MSKRQIHAVVAVPRLSGAIYASYSLCGRYVWNNGSQVTTDKNEVTCLRCLNSNKWHSFLHFNDHVISKGKHEISLHSEAPQYPDWEDADERS